MLAKLPDSKRNRCAKRFLRRRSLVLSSLAGNLWIHFAALGDCKFVLDRTETRRKLRVQGGQVARVPERPFPRSARGSLREMDVHGGSSQTLTGEIGLSEFQDVFAEVFICPETIELQKESLRETHLAATVTRFELASRFQTDPRGSAFWPPPSKDLGRGLALVSGLCGRRF